ncbi:MAG TPA: helix-turn-helix domain-containing protein [Symbiobacteriaceae bacterium]|jgi:hypothetical protein
MSVYHPSLQALLAETGLLPCLAPGSAGLTRPVGSLIFLETGADAANIEPDQLVLVSGQAVRELTPAGLVARLNGAGVAGIIARQAGEPLEEEAARCGLPLVLLPPGANWTGVLEAVQHCLDRARVTRTAPSSAAPRDALLDLAEMLSRATGNPVTVEDPYFGVKAYSSQSGELDPVRVQTILSKRAPEAVHKGFEKYGVMKVLHGARGPVRIEAIPAMGLNGTRVVVPIRAGGSLLGYIWVIESDRKLEDGEMQLLAGAARTAAALLTEQQAGRNLQLRLQEEFLRDLLLGQMRSEEAAVNRLQSLGIHLGPYRVAAALDLGQAASADGPAARDPAARDPAEGAAKDLVSACRGELERLGINGLVGEQSGGAWLLLSYPGNGGGRAAAEAVRQAREAGESLLTAASSATAISGATAPAGGVGPCVGVGNPFRLLVEARQSIQEAQSAVALGRSLWAGRRVIQYEDLGAYRLLAHLDDPAVVEARSHPVLRTLSRYDAENGTDLLPSLEAYFNCAGNVRQAARALTVHPNTMLYRLQRMAEIAGFDQNDSGQRFVLDLEFRLRRLNQQG